MQAIPDKINLNSLIEGLKVEDPEALQIYLKEIFNDLYSRVTENKNDPKEKQVKPKGITKIIFDRYYELPGIIGDRLFKVMDTNNDGVIDSKEFTSGMRILFCEGYEKNSKFIFDFYDFDRDEKIDKEDIRVVLSYITLNDSPSVKSTNINLSYKNRVQSQDELYATLQKCFENIKGKMSYEDFKNTIENVNSDIYLLILLFLLENKPFSLENVKRYSKKNQEKSDKKPSNSPVKLLASPTKNTSFSPYKKIGRKFKRRSSDIGPLQANMFTNCFGNEPGKKLEKSTSPIGDSDKNRKKNKKYTVKTNANIILLQGIGNSDSDEEENLASKKKINEKRIKDLTKKKEKKDAYLTTEDTQIKPAFKQTLDKKGDNNPLDIMHKKDKDKNEEDEDLKEDDLNFGTDSDEDNSDSESSENKNDEENLNYEGLLYKLVDNKMRKLWFKLIHKDLYYYKNKDEKSHKGMHNLSGLFFQEEKIKEMDGKKYYSFSVVYPSKTRFYYCDNEEQFKIWMEKLKKATGYTNLLDLYEVKQKLGNGKFGLVKLGINKNTGQKVAIKIMNKAKMDTSDLELVRTEIEILKICQHPNIIRLYDIFENVNYIYIIMEYCSGGDLFTYLENRKFKIPEERAAIIMHKMCAAIFYIHSYGIAHRDLKPENVLMTDEKEDADIRILDFGLSKIISPNEKCNEPYGTLTYCAPEIIIDEPYTKAVDLWSLGVMTYLMLSGNLPFNAQDETEIARQVAFDQPDFSKKPCWKEISNEGKDFCRRLLEKNPQKRMNIKQALEHDWIKKFSNTNITQIRKKSLLTNSNFGIYTSIHK